MFTKRFKSKYLSTFKPYSMYAPILIKFTEMINNNSRTKEE